MARGTVLAALLAALLVATNLRAVRSQACGPDGESIECHCTQREVNCAFGNFINFRPNMPSNTLRLNMAGNNIASLIRRFVDEVPLLTHLNARQNQISAVETDFMDILPFLEELDLSENRLLFIDPGLFAVTLRLEKIWLSNNRFLTLPESTFFGQNNLREIHLENNALTMLPPKLFSETPALQELYLQGNMLQAIHPTQFSALTNLRVLHLQNNVALATLPPNVFASNTALTTLGMLGSASTCTLGATGVAGLTCDCALGFTGQGASCIPRDCGPVVLDLHPNATADCGSGSTVFGGDDCSAACNAGYLGGGTFYTCGPDGLWQGDLTCTPLECGASIQGLHPLAEATCTGNTRFDGDACVASCITGHTCTSVCTDDQQEYVCGRNGFWQPVGQSLTCTRKDCGPTIPTLPARAEPNPVCSPSVYEDECQVDCDDGYEGGPATFVCNADGKWEGSLNCLGIDCGRTVEGLDPNAETRCRGVTSFGGDDCTATCQQGFFGAPAEYACSALGEWLPKAAPISCERVDCGGDLTVTNGDGRCSQGTKFGDTCPVLCSAGFVGSALFTCNSLGAWQGDLQCERRDCGPAPRILDQNANAECSGDTRFLGDVCTAQCNSGFAGREATFTCGVTGDWIRRDGQPASSQHCFRDCGTIIPSVDESAQYTCAETFFGGQDCMVTCGSGAVVAFRCNETGDWQSNVACAAASSSSGPDASVIVPAVVIPLIVLIILVAAALYYRRRDSGRGRRPKKQKRDTVVPSFMEPMGRGSASSNHRGSFLLGEGETIAMVDNPFARANSVQKKEAWTDDETATMFEVNESTSDAVFPAAWANTSIRKIHKVETLPQA